MARCVSRVSYWAPVQFARLYPLSQSDLPFERQPVDFSPRLPAAVRVENPSRDYTPPSEHPPSRLSDLVHLNKYQCQQL